MKIAALWLGAAPPPALVLAVVVGRNVITCDVEVVVGGGRVLDVVLGGSEGEGRGGGEPPPERQAGSPDESRPHVSPGGQQKSSPGQGTSDAIEQPAPTPVQLRPMGQQPGEPSMTTHVFLRLGGSLSGALN